VTRADLVDALGRTAALPGAAVQVAMDGDLATLEGLEGAPIAVSTISAILEEDVHIRPFSLSDGLAGALADALDRGPGRLPLVLGTSAAGGFRKTNACWVGPRTCEPVETWGDMVRLADGWDGGVVDGQRWLQAQAAARQEAQHRVDAAMAEADTRRAEAEGRRAGAARRRLELELGRYLAAHSEGVDDLNALMYRLMQAGGEAGRRLRAVHNRLGGYPMWSSRRKQALREFEAGLTPARRSSRLSGMELDSALADPRWP
jgi:hypothetical protein